MLHQISKGFNIPNGIMGRTLAVKVFLLELLVCRMLIYICGNTFLNTHLYTVNIDFYKFK